MTPEKLREFTDKILHNLVQGVEVTSDVTSLITIVLMENEKYTNLLEENARLKEALGTAGEHILKLEQICSFEETKSHLVQYQEEDAFAAT